MNIENHIREQRVSFDSIETVPQDAMWIGIQFDLQKRRRRRQIKMYSIAASVAIVVTALFLIVNADSNETPGNQAITPELFSQEKQYYQLATDKKIALGFDDLDEDTYSELFLELDILDSMYIDLKSELSNTPDVDRAIETAIRFHERRLHILELLEKEIENQKRFERHENTIKI